MNYQEKFNRSAIKQIQNGNIHVSDFNGGAIRKASIKFSFSHENKKYFFKIESRRQPQGLEFFGYKEELIVNLYSYNQSFNSGTQENFENFSFIEKSIFDSIIEKTKISDEEFLSTFKSYNAAMDDYCSAMIIN